MRPSLQNLSWHEFPTEVCQVISIEFLSFFLAVKVKRIQKINGKRPYNKKLCCYFCGKISRHRIQKHLENRHKNEIMVAQASAKNSKKERDRLFNKLKNLGNFKFNTEVLKGGDGDLIVCRRPSKETLTSFDYLPCIHCYGFFSRKELWRHTGKCSSNDTKFKDQQGIIARSKFLLAGGTHFCAENEGFKECLPNELKETVFLKIRQDEVYTALVDDPLIIQFGLVLIKQLGPRRTNYVSQRMRQLARLKTKVNALLNVENDLHCYITPKYFDTVVKAVQDLAGYHQNEQKIYVFSTPSLALNLGHSLVKIAEIRRGNAIRQMNDLMKKECDGYLEIHSSDWAPAVSSVALATLQTNKFNKPLALPITSDLVLLKNHLDEQIREMTVDLEKQRDNVTFWKKLAGAAMTRIILFNKRRSSEVSKLLCTSYVNRQNWSATMNQEIASGLKPMERILLKRYDFFF